MSLICRLKIHSWEEWSHPITNASGNKYWQIRKCSICNDTQYKFCKILGYVKKKDK